MKDIAKAYPQLSAEERFKLFMQAVARDDGQEQDRLNNTCPQKSYRCDEWAYTRRKLHFIQLMLWHSQDLRRVETAVNVALVLALASENDNAEKSDEADRAIKVFRQAMRVRASKVEAWKRFCNSMGLPADLPPALGGDIASLMGLPEDMAHEIGGCEPEGELIQREVDALDDYWANLVAKIS